jgi:hypothetical protein
MIARAVKIIVRFHLRQITDPTEEIIKREIVKHFNLTFGSGKISA